MIIIYLIITCAQLRLRRRLELEEPERLKVKMWLFPWLSYAVIVAMMAVLIAMALLPSHQAEFWFQRDFPGSRACRLLYVSKAIGPNGCPHLMGRARLVTDRNLAEWATKQPWCMSQRCLIRCGPSSAGELMPIWPIAPGLR